MTNSTTEREAFEAWAATQGFELEYGAKETAWEAWNARAQIVTQEPSTQLELPDNIVADRHEVTGKWCLQYLTDAQYQSAIEAIQGALTKGDL